MFHGGIIHVYHFTFHVSVNFQLSIYVDYLIRVNTQYEQEAIGSVFRIRYFHTDNFPIILNVFMAHLSK